MLSLSELQNRFVAAIESGSLGDLSEVIAGEPGEARARSAVYRNNYLGNLRDALRLAYPVVERLVGEPFFAAAARAFIARHPSRSGNLDDYGAEFPNFLEGFGPAQSLPYLPDVARLEWLFDAVFTAADAPPLRSGAIFAVLAEAERPARVALAPTARLLASAYPIHRIWRVNQPDWVGEDTIQLSEGGVRLLVRRTALDVEITSIDPAEFEFLVRLRAGASVIDSATAASRHDPAFDAVASLTHRLLQRVLIERGAAPIPLHPALRPSAS